MNLLGLARGLGLVAREYCPRQLGQFDSHLVHGMALAKDLPHPPRILLDYRHGQAQIVSKSSSIGRSTTFRVNTSMRSTRSRDRPGIKSFGSNPVRSVGLGRFS